MPGHPQKGRCIKQTNPQFPQIPVEEISGIVFSMSYTFSGYLSTQNIKTRWMCVEVQLAAGARDLSRVMHDSIRTSFQPNHSFIRHLNTGENHFRVHSFRRFLTQNRLISRSFTSRKQTFFPVVMYFHSFRQICYCTLWYYTKHSNIMRFKFLAPDHGKIFRPRGQTPEGLCMVFKYCLKLRDPLEPWNQAAYTVNSRIHVCHLYRQVFTGLIKAVPYILSICMVCIRVSVPLFVTWAVYC